jgi:hypothetical protein
MRKKLSLSAALATAVALAVLTFGPSFASGTGKGGHDSLVLRAHQDQGTGPTGEPAVGDRFVFADTLYRDDEKVGEDGGSCTFVRIVAHKSATANCVATLSLEHGQITGQGLVTFSDDTSPFTVAVTGGTGAYRSVGGEIEIQPAESEGEDETYTVSLDFP